LIRELPTELNDAEKDVFVNYVASLTPQYASFGLPEVNTTVTIGSQSVSQETTSTDYILNLDYTVFYDDENGDVVTFDGVSDAFKDYLGVDNPGNLVDMANFLNGQAPTIQVNEVKAVSKIVFQPSPAPTKLQITLL